MKRSMCGGILLASLAGMLACSGDPTGDLVGKNITIQANPTSLFLAQGDTKAVLVTVVDEQGNQQALTGLQPTATGGVTVLEDSSYQTTSAGALPTTRRLLVTGSAPGAATVSITANGVSTDVPVKVTPVSASVTVSNTAPAANEGLVITLPAGYKFGSGAGASVEGTAGVVQSEAPDSSAITVLLPPGSTGQLTVDSVAVDFAPGVLFSLPTDQTVTVGAVTPLAGTSSPSTAPAITIQPPGGSTLFYDGGPFDGTAFGFPTRYYKITVADTTGLTTTVDWPSPEDLGLYFFLADGTTDFGSPGDAGGGGAHPESTDNVFPPGTYIMAVINFNTTVPPYYALTITTDPTQ